MRHFLGLIPVILAATNMVSPVVWGAERWALLIGVDKCKAIGELKVCAADAVAIKDLLEGAGYHYSLLVDSVPEMSEWPTLGNVRREVERLASVAEAADTILLFFSGHGVLINGESCLVPSDGDTATAIPVSWVTAQLDRSKARGKMLILDACHAGAAKGVTGIAPDLKRSDKLIMLMSCDKNQVSWPDEDSGHSVFTSALIDGLTGQAVGPTGKVTANSLAEYAKMRVKKWTFTQHKPLQTPLLCGNGGDGVALLDGVGSTIPKKQPVTEQSPVVPEKKWPQEKQVKSDTQDTQEPAVPVRKSGTVRVPSGFKAAPGTVAEPYTGTGWPKEITHTATGMSFVFIPVGKFMMGTEDGVADQKPVHQVRLTNPFYLGKCEVTQGQWESVTGLNPSKMTTRDRSLPVESVSWNECQAFCKKLGDGFRLPTEAEWEYACRTGTGGPGVSVLSEVGWNMENCEGTTHPVGTKKANAWGLCDMYGNVWEWCQDWYGDYEPESVVNPQGLVSGRGRVFRGGGLNADDSYCRAVTRFGGVPSESFFFIGLRLVKEIP
jgi:formylglycine-generating enzyme required for sulfatase activity